MWDVVQRFKAALQVDEVVLGGGNAVRLRALPPGSRRGEQLGVRRRVPALGGACDARAGGNVT